MMPTVYTYGELDYDLVVGPDTVVEPSYDPHCANGEISGGCRPVLVVSAEKLRDYTDGPAETQKIANLLVNNAKMAPYVIDPEAWNCVWDQLIVKGMGLKTGKHIAHKLLFLCRSQPNVQDNSSQFIFQLTCDHTPRKNTIFQLRCLRK